MRASRIGLILAVAALLATPSLAADGETPVLSVELSLEPGEEAGTYRAQLLLSDATTGELLSAPSLRFTAGETVKTRSRTPNSEVIELEVTVAADGSEVTYEAELIRDDERLGLQKATLKLAG